MRQTVCCKIKTRKSQKHVHEGTESSPSSISHHMSRLLSGTTQTAIHLPLLILSKQPGQKLNGVVWGYIKASNYFLERSSLK